MFNHQAFIWRIFSKYMHYRFHNVQVGYYAKKPG